MRTDENKTHWLQSPNKNYLGHWDLPNGEDMIVTIKSAQWEEVKNPITHTSEAKRVIRFEEDIKPMICNQTNAQSILDCTGEKFMEDSVGKKIKLYVSTVKVKREDVDCLRIRKLTQAQLQPTVINNKQLEELENKLKEANKDKVEFCKLFKIVSLCDFPLSKFNSTMKRLEEIKKENENT